ncbi:MAG: DUF1674 domain-containing protein [Gammaproteobacteria bacterium]
MDIKQNRQKKKSLTEAPVPTPLPKGSENRPVETGGPAGPEPTRYGDWERRGRCIDF